MSRLVWMLMLAGLPASSGCEQESAVQKAEICTSSK